MIIFKYLFNFLQQVHTNNKAFTTLEKWIGRRKRYIDFLLYRFHKNDIPLNALEYSFMDDLTNYCKLIHDVCENTTYATANTNVKYTITNAIELNYNLTNALAINPHAADPNIWSMPGWWDCATDDEYYGYLNK